MPTEPAKAIEAVRDHFSDVCELAAELMDLFEPNELPDNDKRRLECARAALASLAEMEMTEAWVVGPDGKFDSAWTDEDEAIGRVRECEGLYGYWTMQPCVILARRGGGTG